MTSSSAGISFIFCASCESSLSNRFRPVFGVFWSVFGPFWTVFAPVFSFFQRLRRRDIVFVVVVAVIVVIAVVAVGGVGGQV